jgi:hypothetical protein
MNYGYQDSKEVGPGKQGGKFGLNTGAHVTKFEYNPNGGKDGAEQDAIDFNVQLGEKEFMLRFFPVTKVFAKKGGGEITDTNSQEYKDGRDEAVALLNGTLSDIVKCYVSEEDLKQALATPIASFKDYAQILQRLVQSVPNWQKVPVDVFLHYQFTPSGSNTRTFLTLPKDVKHGTFIVKSQGPGFKEDRTETHVRYTKEDGTEHPFRRGEWFVKSAFANSIDLGNTSGSGTPMGAPAGAEAAW